ncbi:CocE/NonD family hydrolase [Streptomyces sp. JV185]|uniref:alpha/beta hydrolase family protein n=1 Tax=Streptomyces sp. JV185 TaxID=858638 RepID=UPI002E7A23F5|nr:CocE/NonD family hydrolase [Streptomyces sp. JV185]MEE1767057.1 CocE/NonD family hydrolase [Streptomyces sp. JV185]
MSDKRIRTAKRRRWRAVTGTLIALSLLAVSLGAVVLWQNTYDLREEHVTLRHRGADLDGVLALPEKGEGPFGLVVFVHGDGPVDATHETFYRPIWESFARAGYASLSFSKPGISGSDGNWLDQSMQDRADETLAAVAWARARPDIDGRRIGLWGASQAGWVLPKVAAQDASLRFVIAVSPAIDWGRQGRFNLLAELRRDGASVEEKAAALRRRETTQRLLRAGATVEEYRDATGDNGMRADRWRFIAKNYTSDATADLRAMHGTPVLLVVAGHDINVDAVETEAVYRELLPPGSLDVKRYSDGTHSLVKHDIERSETRLTLTAVFAPRALFADGFLTDQRRFLERLSDFRAAASALRTPGR